MALVASPQTEHHYAQYYLFQQLWFGIGKLYQEERRQDSNLRSCRKKISIDHVCSTSLAKIPQLVTEYATYVVTWNKSLSLSWDALLSHTLSHILYLFVYNVRFGTFIIYINKYSLYCWIFLEMYCIVDIPVLLDFFDIPKGYSLYCWIFRKDIPCCRNVHLGTFISLDIPCIAGYSW